MQRAGAAEAGSRATLAQSAEQALRKRQVIGSIPMGGSYTLYSVVQAP